MVAWENEIEGYTYYIKLEKKLSDNTVEAYLRDLRQMAAYMESEFSISDPEQVREQHVESFLAYLYDKGVEKTTQARVLSGIKSFFTYLLINDRIDSLPTEFIDTPKIGRKLPDVLSAAEVDAMLDGIDLSLPFGHRNRAIMEMLYGCGLRVTELVTLRIGDLFFEEGYVRVVGKGDKQRLVPVSDTAREKIYAYLDCRKGGSSSEETLFLNNRGGRLSRVMIFTIIKQAVLRAGIDKQVSPHTFRHSFATHLLEGGASIRQVQQMLGHESIVTTEIYTHLDGESLGRNVDLHHPLSDR